MNIEFQMFCFQSSLFKNSKFEHVSTDLTAPPEGDAHQAEDDGVRQSTHDRHSSQGSQSILAPRRQQCSSSRPFSHGPEKSSHTGGDYQKDSFTAHLIACMG